ncbi:MAG TPA: hypothetical protein P5275_14025 [Saprospiraceae bacterium]|nr:hypothetical protein [Saprospiraceae bacterium]MCB9272298.1 hypothetical protein [Lewinellaceae bacterium]HPG08093.1 hypothetical protein [Saprospiraceae bacterium]HPR00036.1 hypothetical protein [Saprospiraceae bacterium]HQU54959.1 hypothetical protein [Saprospiraceae bacterium]
MTLITLAEWWNGLTVIEHVFWGVAVIATTLFLIQFVLSLAGLGTDGALELDHDSLENDLALEHEFNLFSIRSILAFFTFFGWIGILVFDNGQNAMVALLLALIAGIAAMSTVAYIMYLLHKLEEEGTLHIESAIGSSGEVYFSIPEEKHGPGKIHVNINGSLREIEAWTEGQRLPTGTKVRIVSLLNKQSVLVMQDEPL